MNITIDTSSLIAVIGNEESKEKIIKITEGSSLCSPLSVHWEIGNALSNMFKKGRILLEQAQLALFAYNEIPIKFIDVSLVKAINLSHSLNIYAYDAYVIQCAKQTGTPLLTLDNGLKVAAQKSGINLLELQS
uniref:PIN domain-containing protein n=1 Tax=Chlorobium chlorochromatii (strain CaD3) TaxID=340177 RepID=Q3ATF2_CHLCH